MAFDPKTFLTSIFDAAVAAADPERTIRNHLPPKPKGRTIVIGAGKGSAQIAAAFEKAWDGALEGLVVTRYGYAASCERIEIIEAAHPVPDAAGLEASKRLLEKVSGLTADDLVVALISGGGSALLPSPADGLTLADEIAVNEALLASGAPIAAMNTIRKHVSTIKGGRLAAAAYPAKVVSLVVSDIPGDNPALVASGPTIPDAGSRAEALGFVAAYGMKLPRAVMEHLNSPDAEAPRADDPRFVGNEVHVIASAAVSLEAAAAEARRQGIETVILSDSIEGEAREVGGVHAAIAREVATRNRPFEKPVLILSGGETTVTLRAKGKGGRNSEFLLAFAIGVAGVEGISALAADTDGIDGSEDNAGAFADGSTVLRMRAAGVDAKAMLSANNAWTAFNAVGDLFVPGPTGTNVNDLRAILVLGTSRPMITRETMMDVLLDADPAFRPVWNQFVDSWADEPQPPPLYIAVGDLSRRLVVALQDGDTESLLAILEVVERWLVEGDDYVRKAAAIGLLENLQNMSFHDSTLPVNFIPWLSPETRRYWDKIMQFWERGTLITND